MAFKKCGEGACPSCGRVIVAKSNEVGTLKIECPHCELRMYAKIGTKVCEEMRARFSVDDVPEVGVLSGGIAGLFGGGK